MEVANKYANERIAIGVSVFLAYFFHYAVFGSVYLLKNGKPNELREIEKNMFLFGVAGILSCNMFQSGVYQAILAYFTLISLFMLHLPVFQANQYFDKKKYFWLFFYFFLFMWYFGIIIDYYGFYANLEA